MWRVFFGGSFNPIHNGHLAILAHIQHRLNTQNIAHVSYVLPTAQNPFKASPMDTHHRLVMLKLAIAHAKLTVQIDTTELMRPPPSYTIDTISALACQYPSDKLIFVMGQDSLHALPTWKDYQAITALANLWVFLRPDNTTKRQFLKSANIADDWLSNQLTYQLSDLHKNAQIFIDDTPIISVSSSQIRQALNAQLPCDKLIPPAVLEYIHRFGLYQDSQ